MNDRSATAKRRLLLDRVISLLVNAAGATIILLIVLILAYLLYTTLPLTRGTAIGASQSFSHLGSTVFARYDAAPWTLGEPGAEAGLLVSSSQVAVRLHENQLSVFSLQVERESLTTPEPVPLQRAVLLGRIKLDGEVLEDTLQLDDWEETLLISYQHPQGELVVLKVQVGESAAFLPQRWRFADYPQDSFHLLDASRAELLVVGGGLLRRIELPSQDSSSAISPHEHSWQELSQRHTGAVLPVQGSAQAVGWGPRRDTLLLVDKEQFLHRFDLVRSASIGPTSPMPFPVTSIGSERQRRVSFVAGAAGEVALFVPSSSGFLLQSILPGASGGEIVLSDDGGRFMQSQPDALMTWNVLNDYPETSARSLWAPQWYEAAPRGQLEWQPDGLAIGALSKYSLTPLLFGTFKAALYGMLFAVPLAIGAAIYTGYFLSTRLRNRVKPTIELLEAFPTVVLGFIAGLWLAPLLADYLLFVLLLPLVAFSVPLLLAAAHFTCRSISPRFSDRPPRLVLLLIAYLLAGVVLFDASRPLEAWLFTDSMSDWLWSEFGVHYDQRNAILIGFAMGIAITPSMFSILEDAIYAVPRSLSDGSLALGATRWQSLAKVVLPAASPALLSALLIGVARGLGETMIVLLATGNSPLLDPSPFSSMRTISATVAIELPEASAGGINFRLLFLSALVLFALTFLFNTIAEIYRQRLRYTYGQF
ncbi:MAG: ABC transporter permease subunit [Pseudomonadota bacterium]